jgi:hypothetical protein
VRLARDEPAAAEKPRGERLGAWTRGVLVFARSEWVWARYERIYGDPVSRKVLTIENP